MEGKVLIYTSNNENKLKETIDHILSMELQPVVIDDGSTDNTKEILKGYSDSIDVLYFDEKRGFDATMLSGFRHILRGTNAKIIITMNIETDDKFYIQLLLENYKLHKKDLYILNRVKSKLYIASKVFNSVFKFLSKLIYTFDAQDHLSTFALFKTGILKKHVETMSPMAKFILIKIYLEAAKDQDIKYEWLPIDEDKKDDDVNYLLSIGALF